MKKISNYIITFLIIIFSLLLSVSTIYYISTRKSFGLSIFERTNYYQECYNNIKEKIDDYIVNDDIVNSINNYLSKDIIENDIEDIISGKDVSRYGYFYDIIDDYSVNNIAISKDIIDKYSTNINRIYLDNLFFTKQYNKLSKYIFNNDYILAMIFSLFMLLFFNYIFILFINKKYRKYLLVSNVSTGIILIIIAIYINIINKVYYGNNYFTSYIKKYIYIIRDEMVIIGLTFILIGLLFGIIFLKKEK